MRRSLALVLLVGSGATIPGFRSPSGNISCVHLASAPATILCTIAHADYAKALQARCLGPTGSGVDWHGFVLTATRKGSISCSGGALYNRASYRTLAYGKTWRQKPFTCASARTGVTCTSLRGHGIFVSRQSWRTW